MNERIKELLLQAALEALKEEPTDYIACDLLKVEKFAELIILECDKVIKDSASGLPEGNMKTVIRNVGEIVKDYFGVE
jgi:hypothetical protein